MIKDILKTAATKLNNPLEARILLSYATGYSQEYLIGHSEEDLSTKTLNKFYEFLERRLNKEPIAYIVGYKEFYGRNFIVDHNVLIPRSDSEVLVDAVLSKWGHLRENGDPGTKLLDLGIGSGCLLFTLLLEMPNAKGLGVDISNEALEIASQNMMQHRLSDRCKLMHSNWFENIDGKYDIIISNPPYISENDKSIMAAETLLYEPKNALYAYNDGYAAYEIIASRFKDFLEPKGSLFLEIGINQEAAIERIFNKAGAHISAKYHDLAGYVRIICVK